MTSLSVSDLFFSAIASKVALGCVGALILPLVGGERCSSVEFCLFSQTFHLTEVSQSITNLRSSDNSKLFDYSDSWHQQFSSGQSWVIPVLALVLTFPGIFSSCSLTIPKPFDLSMILRVFEDPLNVL